MGCDFYPTYGSFSALQTQLMACSESCPFADVFRAPGDHLQRQTDANGRRKRQLPFLYFLVIRVQYNKKQQSSQQAESARLLSSS